MLKYTLLSPGKIITEDVPIPAPKQNEVLIEIKRVGICGSDIHAYYGKHPFMPLPVTPGHEFSGIVHALGEGVTGIRLGERVSAMPQIYCGECVNCKSGRYNICNSLRVIGCQCPGAGQQFLPVDARLIVKLGDMTLDRGAMLEPAAVGIHAVKRAGDVKNKKIVVMGAGTIGNLAAQAARAMGAAVIVTDTSRHRLTLAEKCGIINTSEPAELPEKIKNIFGDDGADVFIECVGVNETVTQAIKLARKGTDIIVAGVFENNISIDMGLAGDKELRIIGTLMYTACDWNDAVEFFNDGKINPDPLVSAHFAYEKLEDAFKYIENNRETAVKVILDA